MVWDKHKDPARATLGHFERVQGVCPICQGTRKTYTYTPSGRICDWQWCQPCEGSGRVTLLRLRRRSGR